MGHWWMWSGGGDKGRGRSIGAPGNTQGTIVTRLHLPSFTRHTFDMAGGTSTQGLPLRQAAKNDNPNCRPKPIPTPNPNPNSNPAADGLGGIWCHSFQRRMTTCGRRCSSCSSSPTCPPFSPSPCTSDPTRSSPPDPIPASSRWWLTRRFAHH